MDVISALVEKEQASVALNRKPVHVAIDQPSSPRLLKRDRFEVVDRLTRFGPTRPSRVRRSSRATTSPERRLRYRPSIPAQTVNAFRAASLSTRRRCF